MGSIAPATWTPPPEARRVRPASITARTVAAIIAAGCLLLLGLASGMHAADAGLGTHTQLGLPACSWPEAVGVPCPTCGMTTSFANASNADLAGSFRVQPFGALLALAAASGFWIATFTATTGSRAYETLGVLSRPRLLWVILALAGAGWAYKIAAHAAGVGG